jgi:membrane fusion protein (multidrug efflux system)
LALAGGAVAASTLLLLACRAETPATRDKVSHAPEALSVRTITIRPAVLQETIVATGTILADESVEVRSEISGKIVRIHFQEGRFVRAGEMLVSINDAELRASLQRAIYRRDLAGLKSRRLSALRNQGGATEQEYDIAVSELNVLAAEVALIEAQLDKAGIRAPFDGVVGLRSVSEGAYVTPAIRIATFQRLARLKVDFSVPEKYASSLQADGAVTVTTAAGQLLAGKIHAIEPLVDAATRTVQIRAICDEPSGRVFSGGFASVRLPLERIPDAIMVPSLAVSPGAADQSVFVVENGQARRRVIRTGTRTESAVQVTEGLQPGDLVIVSGLQQVRAGQPVRSVPEDQTAATAGPGPQNPMVSVN